MSNSLDPDQAWHFVGPDLDPKCLLRLSEVATSGERVKSHRDNGRVMICLEGSV